MGGIQRTVVALLFLVAMFAGYMSAQQSLSTTFAGGNGAAGNMFDLTVAGSGISITALDVNSTTTGSATIEVYYKVGTYVGFETNSSAWTLHESVTVTAVGSSNATNVPFSTPLVFTPNAVYGMYVTGNGSSFSYTNGTGSNQQFSDSNIQLDLGVGKSYPFGSTFSPRVWNGTVYYTAGLSITTPATLPDGVEGSSYSQAIQGGYGTPAYTWQHVSGSLPTGLSLSASGNDFVLSGTPAMGTKGNYSFDVQVTDSTSATKTKTMNIYVDGLSVSTAAQLPDGEETVSYSQNIQAVNGATPYTWAMTSGALPAGLTLTQVGNNYQLSGAPSAATVGSYTFDVQVTDANNSTDTKTLNLAISYAPGTFIYPMTEQDPAGSGFGTSTSTTSFNFGWRFKVNTSGVTVLRLGCDIPGGTTTAKTVTLFDVSTQAVLAQVVCGPGSGWQWTNLSNPVALANGSEYVVAGLTNTGYYNSSSPPASWSPTGDIEFLQCQYSSTTTASTFPTTTITGLYGVADIGYTKGLSVISDSQMPSGAESTSYSANIQAAQGTLPYTWSHVSGTLPSGLSLTQVGNDFQLAGSPAAGTPGTYNFVVKVTDAVSDSNSKSMTLYIMPQPASLPFADDFSTDKGWQYGTAEWTRGPAVAYNPTGGAANRLEPGTDNTPSPNNDNMIAGHVIGGDYAANMPSMVWLTSPPVDCSGAATVSLRFYRFLGVTLTDSAKIQVTNNGSNWNDVWVYPGGSSLNDATWTFTGYDITTWAAGNSVVQVRFGIGPTSTTVNTGWCIDDVQIIDPGPELEVREGGAAGTLITDNEANGGLRDFGQLLVSTNSSSLDINLYNNGLNTINITNFGGFPYNKTGANPGDFTVTGNPGWTIAPGNSTTLTVQFYSTTPGVSTCTIEIGHDAAGSGTTPFEINLRAEAIPNTPTIQVDMTTSGGTNIPYQASATGTARDFGSVNVGNSSTPITIVLTNIGTGPLTVSTVDMGGTWWNQFAVNPPATMPAVLNNGQSASFTVAFQPTSAGVKDGHVRIVHNGVVSTSPFEVPVQGNAVTTGGPLINVSDTASTIAHNAAVGGPRDFGNVLVGSSSAPIIITVTNSGGAIMTVGTPTLGGTNPGEFSLNTTGFGPTVAVGTNSTFTITFSPTSVGAKTATVTFTHDDTTVTSPFVINVQGSGVNTAAVIVVRETSNSGAVITNPGAATGILDFGTQDIAAGATAAATIYVENTGTAALTLGTPDFNPTGNTEFSINTTGWPASLAIGTSATFSITFDPTTGGVQTGVVEFTHNDTTAGSPFILNVTGTGASPIVEVREGSTTGAVVTSGTVAALGGGRDLGSIDVSTGATGPVTVTLINTGSVTLTLGAVTLSGTHAADFILNTTGMSSTLAPAANTSFTVTFDPTLGGIKNAQIEFIHDDPSSPSPFIVPILGTAVDPAGVTITTASLPSVDSGSLYPATTLTAVNGVGALTWSLYSGNLPSGMTLSASGVITGTPTTLATTVYNLIIRVADTPGGTHERALSITVVGDLVVPVGSGGVGGCTVGGSTLMLPVLLLVLIACRCRRRRYLV